jgi:hypothetical protein
MDKDEALDLALEALEYRALGVTSGGKDLDDRAITAIKQALAAPVQPVKPSLWEQALAAQQEHEPENEPFVSLASVQEPVAWVDLLKQAEEVVRSKPLWKKYIDGTPLANDIAVWMASFAQEHITPPAAQRQWAGLTDEEVYPLANEHLHYQTEGYEVSGVYNLARAIEAKLKEKNT